MKQFTLEEKNQVLENPFIHIHRKLDVLLNIGKLLMECGANTNRIIEETVMDRSLCNRLTIIVVYEIWIFK